MKRISIADILLNGINTPKRSSLIKFADGSHAIVNCFDRSELQINYAGTSTTVRIVAHLARNRTRFYFFDAENKRRVLHLYFLEDVGFVSRIAAGMSYSCENRLREHRIPRMGSPKREQFAVMVER